MDLSLLAPYILACLAIELTPGPNMAYLALLSADRGRLAGLFAVAGVRWGSPFSPPSPSSAPAR